MISKEDGFSITELLVVFLIGGILAATAVPSYFSFRGSIARSTAVNQLEVDFRRAKVEARKTGSRVILSVGVGGKSYTFGTDSAPYNDPVASDATLFSTDLPSGVTLEVDDTIIFDPRGRLIDSTGALNQRGTVLKQDGTTFAQHSIYASGFIDHL